MNWCTMSPQYASLADGMGDKAELGCVAYGKYLYVRCLTDLIDGYPSPFGMDRLRKEVQERHVADGHDDNIGIEARSVFEVDLLFFLVIFFGKLRPEYLRALCHCGFDLFAEGSGLLNIHSNDR